jgi:hypothetical protein
MVRLLKPSVAQDEFEAAEVVGLQTLEMAN